MSGGIHNRTFFHQSFRSRSALRSRIRQNLTNRSYGREYGPTGSTRISAVSATYFLIALNTGVFAGWVYAQATQEQRLLRTLRQNFTLSWQNWREGRQWTILTSAFSHANFVYFAFNMLTFSAFGIMLSWVPGIGAFHVLALSLGSGIAGSIAWLYQKQMPSESGMGKIIGPFGQGAGAVRQSARGASGMVVGVGAAAACLMPWAKLRITNITSSTSIVLLQTRDSAAMAVDNDISFDDLPPEIRNEIYSLTLCSDTPAKIDAERRLTEGLPRRPRVHVRSRTDKIPHLNATLLRISHRIYAEAAPILYGANTFSFVSESTLHTFLEMIGDSRKYVRRIEIMYIGDSRVLRSALHLLKQAKQLESFECQPGMLRRLFLKKNQVKALLPWLKTLQKGAQGVAGRKGALEILTFAEPFSTAGGAGPAWDRHCAEHERLHAEVMALLRQGLGS
ncbi:hypothetical protein LTR33_008949 [Friedmanniomyces endolithicus]|nr:hypothetical protein LTR33_008949 [Friedmanniomyces endolithicus]